MNFKTVWGFAGAVLYAQLATGCGSAATPDGIAGSGGAASGPPGGAAKAVSGPDKAGAPVLFKDPHVSGLRLDVYEVGGYPVVAVHGHIGTAPPALPAKAMLAEIYMTLHPDEAVPPSALAPLDARLAPLRAAIAPALPIAAQTATVEKNLGASAFYWYFCNTIPADGTHQWVPQDCEYSGDIVSTGNAYYVYLGEAAGLNMSQSFPLQRGDEMFVMNLTNTWTSLNFTVPSGQYYDYVGDPIWVEPDDWTWVENYGPGPYGAINMSFYDGEVTPEGEIGLTLQRLSSILK